MQEEESSRDEPGFETRSWEAVARNPPLFLLKGGAA